MEDQVLPLQQSLCNDTCQDIMASMGILDTIVDLFTAIKKTSSVYCSVSSDLTAVILSDLIG